MSVKEERSLVFTNIRDMSTIQTCNFIACIGKKKGIRFEGPVSVTSLFFLDLYIDSCLVI